MVIKHACILHSTTMVKLCATETMAPAIYRNLIKYTLLNAMAMICVIMYLLQIQLISVAMQRMGVLDLILTMLLIPIAEVGIVAIKA